MSRPKVDEYDLAGLIFCVEIFTKNIGKRKLRERNRLDDLDFKIAHKRGQGAVHEGLFMFG